MPSLIEVRQNRRLSQGELADRARIGVSTVYRIEHGRTAPRLHIIRRLCAVLGVQPEDVTEFGPLVRSARFGRVDGLLTPGGTMAERDR